jgi:hypothetical protein
MEIAVAAAMWRPESGKQRGLSGATARGLPIWKAPLSVLCDKQRAPTEVRRPRWCSSFYLPPMQKARPVKGLPAC